MLTKAKFGGLPRWGLLLVAMATLLACGPKETRQVNSSPEGAIVGRVTTIVDGAPITGVEVAVLLTADAGARRVTATTADDGTYTLRGLPAGVTYTVRFLHPDYVTRMAQVGIPSAAGEFPQGNAVVTQNMWMARPDASLVGVVFAGDGLPAPGVAVRLDLRPVGFDLVAETVTDSAGAYSLTGLPGAPTGLTVTAVSAPYDENGDGDPDYSALSQAADLFPAAATILDFDLRTVANAFRLLYSDVDDGLHPATDDIYATFNRPVDFSLTTATLHDDTRNVDLAAEVVPDASGASGFYVATADGEPLTVGVSYTLTIDAWSELGLNTTVARSFVATGAPATLDPVTGVVVVPTDANWATRDFVVVWDFDPAAAGYRVYIRDNRFNLTFHEIATVGNSPTPGASFRLPASYDVFSADFIQTPFAFFGQVDFAVVPLDEVGAAGDVGAAEVVSIVDNIGPRITQFGQSGSADNTGGGSSTDVYIDLEFNEYMDDVPLVVTTNGTGVTAAFDLDPTLYTGTLIITVPAGVDASGAIDVDGGSDTSGNPLQTYSDFLF